MPTAARRTPRSSCATSASCAGAPTCCGCRAIRDATASPGSRPSTTPAGSARSRSRSRRSDEFRVPVRETYAGEEGWRRADLRESPGDFHLLFVEMKPDVFMRYGRTLIKSGHWLQRQTKYGDIQDDVLEMSLRSIDLAIVAGLEAAVSLSGGAALSERLVDFLADVREEYFSALAHLLDSRYYRTHGAAGAPAGKYAAKRRGYVVSIGQDLGAIKISGWTHTIPE